MIMEDGLEESKLERVSMNTEQMSVDQEMQTVNVPATLFNLFIAFGNMKPTKKTRKVSLTEQEVKEIQYVMLDLLYAAGFTVKFSPNEDGSTNCTLVAIPSEVSDAVAQVLEKNNE